MTRDLAAIVRAFLLVPALMQGIHAAEYVIAPDGDDAHAGTLAQPFASVARAQAAVAPGDTVLIRGGTYHVREEQIARKEGIFAHVFVFATSGTKAAPITYAAYPGERPVFDFAAVRAEGLRIIAFSVGGSWLRFRGFDVVGVQVTMKAHTQSECFENLGGSDNIYQDLAMHDGQAIGFYLVSGSDNLVLDCDAYRNHDHVSEDGKGGNTDGFGCHPRRGSTGNVFRGCRAWFNSDDGYDCISACEAVVFDHCWAMYNGYSTTFASLGDGNGFKAGGWARTPTARLPSPMPRHTVRFCLAVRNKASGFYANHHLDGGDWLNNTAYRNGNDFNMLERVNDPDGEHFDLNVPGARQVLKNNLGYKGGKELTNLDAAHSEAVANSFDLGLTITDADFLSVDEEQVVRPRRPDGGLPDVTFLRPAPGSQLVDRGVEIGFPFAGGHPDVGCFESR